MSNRIKILFLEAQEADADTVQSLVGIVREVQVGNSIERLAETRGVTGGATMDTEPLALPAPKPARVSKPRAAAPGGSVPRGRASDVGAKAIAYLRKSPRVDYPKLSLALYGSSDPQNVKRSRNVLNRLVHTGKAKSDGAGTYTVVG